jgi:hypothetical protein
VKKLLKHWTTEYVEFTVAEVKEALAQYARAKGHEWVDDTHVTNIFSSGALAVRSVEQ